MNSRHRRVTYKTRPFLSVSCVEHSTKLIYHFKGGTTFAVFVVPREKSPFKIITSLIGTYYVLENLNTIITLCSDMQLVWVNTGCLIKP